jgi:hypothetical protein
MSECTNLLVTIPDFKKMAGYLQQRYEENIETELNEDETKEVNKVTDNLQNIITKVNKHIRIPISFDSEKFIELVQRLYRLPDKSVVGGDGPLTLTNGEDVTEVPRRSTLSYDFSAILLLLSGICLIYMAYNILLQTPEKMTEINPLFKEIYDATVSNYGTNEVTVLAFIWNSITNFSCSEHTSKIENIITTVITQTMTAGMTNALQTASTTCMIPTTLVADDAQFLGMNIGTMLNFGATTVTTMLNQQQITACTNAAIIAAQGKFMSDMAFYNNLLISSTVTQVTLITRLVTMGVGMTYSSLLYLIYRGTQEVQRVMNRPAPATAPATTTVPALAITDGRVDYDYDGLEPRGGKLRKKAKKTRKNKNTKTRKMKRGNKKQSKNRKRRPTKKR